MSMTLRRIFSTTCTRTSRSTVRAKTRFRYSFSILFLCFLTVLQFGCATKAPPPAFAPMPPEVQAEPPGYESPPLMVATDVVPGEMLTGPHHEVDQHVVNDGFTNHYLVVSDFGDFPAAGFLELEQRVAEVQAIAVLEEMNRREAFGKGAAAGVKRTALTPVRQVKRYINNPLHLVLAVPGDAMRAVGVFEDVRKLARLGFTKAYLKDLIGFEDAKKGLALRLGVQSDSPNPVLQAELNRAAWSYYGGSAPMYLLEEFVPLVPMPHVILVAGGESLGEATDIFENEVGRKSINTQLKRMGVEKAERKAFKKHPAYTSRERKNLVRSLYKLDDAVGRENFVIHALEAKSAEEAHIMVREAQTVSVYDAMFDEIVEMARVDDAVLCYTKSGVVMMPLYADYVAWTRAFADRVEALMAWQPESGEVVGREIWVAGRFTPWAQRELEARNVAIHDHAIDVLTKAAHDRESEKNGFIARLRRNKAGRAIERLADAADGK